MRSPLWMLAVCFVAGVTACADSPADPGASREAVADVAGVSFQQGGPPLAATVRFGLEFGERGSPFPVVPPPPFHDQSLHAYVKIHPRTTVIAAGGTVTFEMAADISATGNHSIGLYDVGKQPADIDPTVLVAGLINDDAGDLLFSTGRVAGTSEQFTFSEPGRYLVICRVPGHFTLANMYAWVIVK